MNPNHFPAYYPHPYMFPPPDPNAQQNQLMLTTVITAISDQSSRIKQLTQQQSSLLQKFEQLKSIITELKSDTNKEPGPIPTKRDILQAARFTDEDYPFSLELSETIANPICKGKYFVIQTYIQSMTQQILPHSLHITLRALAYTADCPPKQLQINMQGSDILHIHSSTRMKYDARKRGFSSKLRLQVNEVTSHFRNGWIFLLIIADVNEGNYKIRPLVIKNLVVKAKELTCMRWRQKGMVRKIRPENFNGEEVVEDKEEEAVKDEDGVYLEDSESSSQDSQ